MTVNFSNLSSNKGTVVIDSALTATPNATLIGNLQINGSQNIVVTTPVSYPYTVLSTDSFISASSASPNTILLPASPESGMCLVIQDATGNASINNITIDGNGNSINGSSTIVISTNYGRAILNFNSTSWLAVENSPSTLSITTDVSGPVTGMSPVLTMNYYDQGASCKTDGGVPGQVYFQIYDGSTQSVFIGSGSGGSLSGGAGLVGIGNGSFAAAVTDQAGVAIGSNALVNSTGSTDSVGIGRSAGSIISTGTGNVAVGSYSLGDLGSGTLTGDYNTCLGFGAMMSTGFTSATRNIAIGYNAGGSFGATTSYNIAIGSNGSSSSNRTYIGGGTGTSAGQQNFCNISGIRGITTANANAIAVLIDSAGQLGTVSSSLRFKENVQDLADQSSPILNLRPVSFNFKDSGSLGYGLIAEEVASDFPYLCATDDEGLPFSVKYHELPALLLNELQKAVKRIADLEAKVSALTHPSP